MSVICEITIQTPAESLDGYFNIQTFLLSYVDMKKMEKIYFYTLQWLFLQRRLCGGQVIALFHIKEV